MSRKKTPEPYEVGYGKPPKANQFKPGQSGNRKGRPKKPKNTVPHINDELDQTITITENGKKHRITKRAAIYKRLVNGALKGDIRKIELVSRLSDKNPPPEPFVPNEQDDAELLRVLEKLSLSDGKPDATR